MIQCHVDLWCDSWWNFWQCIWYCFPDHCYNPGQCKVDFLIWSSITIGKLPSPPPHHTTTTTTTTTTMSYEVTIYIWMLLFHSWGNDIPFLCKTKLWESKIDDFRNIISLQISRREKELSKPNLTSLCTDVLVQLNSVSTNTIYPNKRTWFWLYSHLTYWCYLI